MSEMTYDEAIAIMDEIEIMRQVTHDLDRLAKAYGVPLLTPTPDQIAESEALPDGAEDQAVEILGAMTKKEAKAKRLSLSKWLIAAGVAPNERKKIYRLQKKGAAGQEKLGALFEEIRAKKELEAEATG